jgi:chromosomal replication initiator protein
MNAGDAEVRERKIKAIQEAVASRFGISVEDLRQDSRQHVVAVARQVAMYLTKQMTDASLSEIGQHFGGRHHTTVTHSIAKVHVERHSDAALDRIVSKLVTSLTCR